MKKLFTNILVAVTGSDASIMAAKHAIVMAKSYHCKLNALYVVDTATIKQLTLSRIFIPAEGAEYEISLETNGHRYLRFVEELAHAKGIKIEKSIRKGAVYMEILRAAEEFKTDLIVMGGWESGRSSREIIGQAHREIMNNAKCSVLFVKDPNINQIYKSA